MKRTNDTTHKCSVPATSHVQCPVHPSARQVKLAAVGGPKSTALRRALVTHMLPAFPLNAETTCVIHATCVTQTSRLISSKNTPHSSSNARATCLSRQQGWSKGTPICQGARSLTTPAQSALGPLRAKCVTLPEAPITHPPSQQQPCTRLMSEQTAGVVEDTRPTAGCPPITPDQLALFKGHLTVDRPRPPLQPALFRHVVQHAQSRIGVLMQ